ncbi:MAG: PDZ domain-containing protein [Desulfamplus sp.]|nr:PDZ domain-containing protein [Desulfamplus sp.]MBF0240879.1 PDZ domain-containing protein [Desulfamplus sp.]
MYDFKNNSLIAITLISLIFNAVAVVLLFQDRSNTNADEYSTTHKSNTEQSILDYEQFKTQWGTAWIGVNISDVTPLQAAKAMLDRPEGAYVNSVDNNSPAQRAGIESGNIILSFNGRKIRTAYQFQNDLAGSEIGVDIYMCVSKNNEYTETIHLLPEERPEWLAPLIKSYPYFGVTIRDVSDNTIEAAELEDAEKEGGVLVEKVLPNSPAERGGILEGDIIMSFNSRKTRSVREFLSDLAGCEPYQTIRICIIRGDIRKTLTVTLERSIL